MATILAVDDEFGILEVITMALEEQGHHVVTAANGRQGLECLARETVGLVLLDFMMPLLDGPGMLRAMRADPALCRIPVVMMSSLSKAAMQQECAGCAAYLRKPFSIALLPSLVAQILGQASGDAAGGQKS